MDKVFCGFWKTTLVIRCAEPYKHTYTIMQNPAFSLRHIVQ